MNLGLRLLKQTTNCLLERETLLWAVNMYLSIQVIPGLNIDEEKSIDVF